MTSMYSETPRRAARRAAAIALALAAAGAAAACRSRGDQAPRAGTTDTGSAAAPSGKGHPDLSATPNVPDSATGVAHRTERPGISGDSLGRTHEQSSAAEAPAIPRDTTSRTKRDTQP